MTWRGFIWPVRVYYDDTDAGGVVYHTQYLRMMEHARTEWLRSLGFEQDELRRDQGRIFVVVRLEIDYLRPAFFNEKLAVTVQIKERTPASLLFHQKIHRRDDQGLLLCEAEVKVACVNVDNLRPSKLPPLLVAELERNGW
jgi:acyl-CoA thioester hydrolase